MVVDDDVSLHTYARTDIRSAHAPRYPNDVAVVQRIVRHLAAAPGGGERLPSGTLLTPRAFQLLGLSGLGSGGGFERLHYLLESFFDDDDEMTPGFAKSFESW